MQPIQEEETDCSTFKIENVEDDIAIDNPQKTDYELKHDEDVIPKDAGWAWMCCLGTV